MNPPADLVRIVIDETDRLIIINGAVISYRPNDHLSSVACPVDQNLFPSADLPDSMIKTMGQPSPSHKENQEHRVDDENRQGIAFEVEDPMHQNIKNDRARHNCGDDVSQVPDAGVTPEAFVNLERNKGYSPDHDEPGEHLQEKRPFALRNQTIKPDPESQVV